MLYLGGDKGWVRKNLIAFSLGDPVPAQGQQPEHKVNNGITGDARRSTVALGKRSFDMKVEYAVSQIRLWCAKTSFGLCNQVMPMGYQGVTLLHQSPLPDESR
jgi:hypothetical protein